MNVAKSFSIYTIASFFNKGLMAILAFFLSHYILPAENGILSLYSVFVALILPFVILGMPSSIMLEHSKLEENEFKLYFNSSLALSGISFFLLLIIFIITGRYISGALAVPFRLLLMGLLYAWFNLFQENITSYIRTINKPMQFLWLSVIRDAIEIGLVILLVISWGRGAEGRIWSGVITGGVVFLYALYYFHRKGLIHKKISKKYLKEEMKFGFSQIFFQFNVFILMSSDKFFINHFNPTDKSGLGIYFLASQFAFIINVLVNAFFSAYQPQLYKYLGDFTEANKFKMIRIKYLFAGFLLLATVLLCLAVPLAYKWFINKDYHVGIPYVIWNAFGFFFWGLYALLLGILYYFKKNRAVIGISIFSSLLCISLNYLLIKQYGLMGACYANLITYTILFMTIFVVVASVIKINIPWLQFSKIFKKQV